MTAGPTVDLDGRVALVTGAASGIGRACAARYAALGATVVLSDVTDEAGSVAAGELGGTYAHLDVADPGAWATMADDIRSTHGRLDVLHLNAGIRLGADDVTATAVDDYLHLIAINQHGVFYGVRAMVPLIEATGGAIVVTASLASIIPLPNDLPYSMAKHAVAGLVRSAASDLERRGVTINAICPATVDTGFLAGAGRERLEAAGIEVMDADEVADGVVTILASGLTGRCFTQLRGGGATPFEFARGPR